MPGECWKNVSGFISAYEHVRAKLLEAYFVAVFSFLGSTAHPFTANLVALLRGNERIQAKEHDLLRFARPSRKELSAELELRANAGFRSQCLRFPSVAGPILLSRRNGALIGLKLSIMSKPLLRTHARLRCSPHCSPRLSRSMRHLPGRRIKSSRASVVFSPMRRPLLRRAFGFIQKRCGSLGRQSECRAAGAAVLPSSRQSRFTSGKAKTETISQSGCFAAVVFDRGANDG